MAALPRALALLPRGRRHGAGRPRRLGRQRRGGRWRRRRLWRGGRWARWQRRRRRWVGGDEDGAAERTVAAADPITRVGAHAAPLITRRARSADAALTPAALGVPSLHVGPAPAPAALTVGGLWRRRRRRRRRRRARRQWRRRGRAWRKRRRVRRLRHARRVEGAAELALERVLRREVRRVARQVGVLAVKVIRAGGIILRIPAGAAGASEAAARRYASSLSAWSAL